MLFMSKLYIVIDYNQVEQYWRKWGTEEDKIDFRSQLDQAKRCTTCYAAIELRYFLCKAMPNLEIIVSQKKPLEEKYIELKIDGNDTAGSFKLTPQNNGILVTGFGRNGLLNGCYELLRIQGWTWLEPGIYGECAPKKANLDFLRASGNFEPSFKHRMIDQYRESDASVELLKWYSRNRINVVFRKAATGQFSDKLGMLSRTGGHLLQKLMDPNAIMEDGRTVWEAHPEWYGLPANGKRTKDRAIKTQLCLSNKELIKWLSNEICTILKTSMKDIDILDLWGLDGGGKTCSCENCYNQGNGSDQNLKLLSHVQAYLLENLGRPVMLNTVSYDNSDTMVAPTLPVPQNLIDTGCFVIFYPIHRCYNHQLKDRNCKLNNIYDDAVTGWHQNAPKLSLWAGEYYNVSRFEDMPLVFGKMIPKELRYYLDNGCTGSTYMHNPSPNWGIRALTQLLHTQYSWNVDTNYDDFVNDYLKKKYKNHSKKMKKVYSLWEEVTKNISLWRTEFISVLAAFESVEGEFGEPEITLSHFATEESCIAALKKVVKTADTAIAKLKNILKEEQLCNWKDLPALRDLPPLVVPTDLEYVKYYNKVEHRLSEDLRGLLYGAEILRLEYLLLKYHNLMRVGKSSNKIWQQIEETASRLNEMYMPVTYEKPTPGVNVLDGLTRSQLRMTITRYRGQRIKEEAKRKKRIK